MRNNKSEMGKKILWDLFVVTASSLNYASLSFLYIIWKLDFLFYLPLLLVASLLMGLATIDEKRALIYACISLFLGTAIAVMLMAAPPILLGEGAAATNETITTALSGVSRLLIFTLILYILGALGGSLLSQSLEPLEEIQV